MVSKTISAVLVLGFLAVDWLLFHDAFKVGETHTTTDYLVAGLSVLVFAAAGRDLVKK
ncbi:MAG TPA: hypothetical protein VLE97_10095 [Gaiellaceae bacterium]|nr:hypothetical protein [Gaiellaceae bacterium]